MMRVLAITPICVNDSELARRQDRYNRLSPAGVSVSLENLGTGSHVPRALETEQDISASEAALIVRLRGAQDAQVHALMPDCVLDPAVGLEQEKLRKPVLGILRLSAHFLVSQGATVGALARNAAIAAELDRKLFSYGIGMPQGATAVLGLSVEDISDDQRWAAAVAQRLRMMRADHVINGCSAVDTLPAAGKPVLVDPTAMALRLIGLLDTGAAPVSAAVRP